MRDKLRNPKDRSDPELYTIHFRERLISDLYEDCVSKGQADWPALSSDSDDDLEAARLKQGFKVSERVYRDQKPFNIREAKRDQCLCIWHLRWEYLAEA